MELPVKEVTVDIDVVSNDIVFFQEKNGKYKYFQVKSMLGGTPGINSKTYPNTAIWVLLRELDLKGIKLFKLLREEETVAEKFKIDG